ncbi:MAG TPA: DUF4269 domain-containing protein [Polyangiaceae bacterium]|nr:DUF4269 domain-containing protein [Polyangiaceae bacterium]
MSSIERLFSALAPYGPTLVGTYPLGLQTSSSDLDVICCCADLSEFEQSLSSALRNLGTPTATPRRIALSPEASVTSLACDGLPIEVFCQGVPVYEQHGFRHMIIEGRLLRLGASVRLRERVLALRRTGLKTEPAFAKLLGLAGDPYAALLELESQSSAQLLALLATTAGT